MRWREWIIDDGIGYIEEHLTYQYHECGSLRCRPTGHDPEAVRVREKRQAGGKGGARGRRMRLREWIIDDGVGYIEEHLTYQYHECGSLRCRPTGHDPAAVRV